MAKKQPRHINPTVKVLEKMHHKLTKEYVNRMQDARIRALDSIDERNLDRREVSKQKAIEHLFYAKGIQHARHDINIIIAELVKE